MCLCVRVWRRRLFSVCNRNWHAHSTRTGEGLRKKFKKIMHRVPCRGVNPRVTFLDDANDTHFSLFEHMPTPVLCRLYSSLFFAKPRAIEYHCRRHLLFKRFRFHLNSDCICTESNLHVLCSKHYTGSVSKQARRARFEFIQHIRDLATKIARDVSTYLSLHYSILSVRRTGHGS